MTDTRPEIVDVRGGVAGVAASYAAARKLADAFDSAGDRLRDWGASGLRVMRDPDLLESGLLAPGTCAAAEAAVLAATGGPEGVVVASLGWEADAVCVRAAIECLELTDDAVRLAVAALDRELAVAALPELAVVVATDPDLLTEEPGLLEHLVNGLGGPAAAGLLTVLYGGPGRPVVTPYAAALAGDRPATVRALLEHLHQVASLSGRPDSPANGTVEVQTIAAPDGTVRHVLYLPGTDDFNPPWDQDGDVRDLETDLDSMGGRPDAYRQGILEALHQAGVGPDEPLLVVGHSLGGMEAAALAAHHHGYHVTDVVTAGSPTAQVGGFASGTHVLSLEQLGDVVPELDGAPNPDSVAQTTVTFDAHPG
ncbi:MAG TPA: alpha/beta hydrolase, partial [Nocardioides sp.]|nr:alpha/beta hydrolase [Nocardioides sp.]